jgi:5-methylcytosine-specific restriction endonuclease McrA
MKPQRRQFGRGYTSTGDSDRARWKRKNPDRAEFIRSPAWRWARREQLAKEPNCWCGEKATAVAHIVPISQGGADQDPANLRSLCKVHHAQRGGGVT